MGGAGFARRHSRWDTGEGAARGQRVSPPHPKQGQGGAARPRAGAGASVRPPLIGRRTEAVRGGSQVWKRHEGRKGWSCARDSRCRALARIPPPARMQQGRPSLCCVSAVRGSRGAPEPGEGGRGLGGRLRVHPRVRVQPPARQKEGQRGWGGSLGFGGEGRVRCWGWHGEERGARGRPGGSSPCALPLLRCAMCEPFVLAQHSLLSPAPGIWGPWCRAGGAGGWGGAAGALGCTTAAAAPATEQSLRRSLLCRIPGWFPPSGSPLSHLLLLWLSCLASSPVCWRRRCPRPAAA